MSSRWWVFVASAWYPPGRPEHDELMAAFRSWERRFYPTVEAEPC